MTCMIEMKVAIYILVLETSLLFNLYPSNPGADHVIPNGQATFAER